ncbi:LysR family transcriptional regulator ArgP [Amphritea sp. 1_MG-2023]|uniref:LysR family transcriptional regulator ArgP n=1 Tax=Amphritea sp. 1_MG-2023 TaxID=3062670 RepID=UPI0026E2A83F|nr:LysR family transcriptional regulator ArgP [Amphritea sp. 1_MG-2023]MDO6562051.1 LysR family transcriptional regulator ArgP [Amphritea sp. 1_MG-2023]
MFEYRQLQALATVIEEQSFERAAKRLFLTQSAISQRVKQLEEAAGQLLLIRSQPLRLTDAGQHLQRHYHQISLLQSELLNKLKDVKQQGFTRLTIGLNADSLATWFMDAMQPLMEQSPILLDLRIDDQEQTHLLLRQGDVQGCISASSKPLQGSSAVFLGISRYLALASPAFIQRYFPNGVCSDALTQAPAVEYNEKDDLQNSFISRFYPDVQHYQRHRVPSSEAFTELIKRGFAWGMAPDLQMQALLNSGAVTEIVAGQSIAVPLYWHSWNLATDTGHQLSEQLIRYCQCHLEQAPISRD